MNDEDVLFDMDENMGSYYDFNLLDLLEDNDETPFDINDSENRVKVDF